MVTLPRREKSLPEHEAGSKAAGLRRKTSTSGCHGVTAGPSHPEARLALDFPVTLLPAFPLNLCASSSVRAISACTDILRLQPRSEHSALSLFSAWGVVFSPVAQITDSEAHQTHEVSAHPALSGSNSVHRGGSRFPSGGTEWQTGAETPGFKFQLLPFRAM